MQTQTRSLMLACILLMSATTAQAAIVDVPTDHMTLAAAVAAAGPGDTIVLAPGVYTETAIQLHAGITIRGGGSTPSDTVIDAGGVGRILLIDSVTDSTVISNLTFSNAAAVGKISYEQSGGAIFISKSLVRVENCVFLDNYADSHGGAIRISASSPLIRGCTFRGNQAPNGGGGAIEASFGSSPHIEDCDFENNFARWGGAVTVRMGGLSTLIRARMVGNTADGDLGYGGAIFADNGSVIGVVETIMSGNDARFGGAVACFPNAQTNLAKVTMTDNTARFMGGGMLVIDSTPYVSNTNIAFNTGVSIGLSGTGGPVITCSNIYGNSGGDWVASLTAITNMDQNYSVDPMFCSRDPWAAGGLGLPAGSILLEPGIGCGSIGVTIEPCDLSPVPDVPAAGRGLTNVLASPNPFNPRTNIKFTLSETEEIEVAIYGIRGELIRVLAQGPHAAGDHAIAWNGRDHNGQTAASGLYFAVVRSENQTQSLKVTMLK